MLTRLRSRLTFSNVIACTALFVALGGTSVAAVSLKKNSVGSRQIKNSSITGTDIKNSSIGSSDVKNRSLLSRDFKSGQLPAGARGPQGVPGTAGAPGATNIVIRTATTTIPAQASGGFLATARCDSGQRATGGGLTSSSPLQSDSVTASAPVTAGKDAINPPVAGETPTGWSVLYGVSPASPTARTVTAYAVCASP